MATKNLVPRQDSEGKLGLPTRRWAGINATLGLIQEMKTDTLNNTSGAPLLVSGDNITIENFEDGSGIHYKISSSSAGSSQVDKIFEGEEGAQTSVEAIKTSDPLENKISFSISGDEKWYINDQGHFVPRVSDFDLGLSSLPIRDLYLLNDGLNLGSSNLRIDNASKNLQIGTLVNESLVYENVTTSLEDVKFATTEPIDLTTALVNGIEIDGQILTTGDRVLVKDQATPSENGIYIVSAAEGPAVRANDLIATSDFSGVRVAVLKGDSNTQKIFFTVPHTDGSSRTATSNMKWVKLGSGGLEAVEDDPAPVLGGDLSVGTHSIKTSADELRMIAKSDSAADNAKLKLQSTDSGNVLVVTSNTNGDTKLSLETQGGKSLRIENVDDTFFTNNNIPLTFTYKFNDPTQSEIDTRTAYFATQGWVSDQGFLTSSSLDNYVTDDEITDFITAADLPDLTNYIQSNGDASLNSLTLVEQPQNDADAANKQYVDLVVQGLREVLQPVRLATTTNINLADQLENNDLIDGVNVSTGDRILVRDQNDPRDNGIYIVQASGAAVRSSDFELNDEVSAKFVFVEEGDTYAQSGFICTSPETADTVGNDDILFAKFSAAGQTEAGAALSKTGNVFDVKTDGTSIEVDPDNNYLKIKNVDSTLLTGTIDVARLPDIPVSKISGDIIASSVNENAINPDDIDTVLNSIADDDLFIVRDVSANSPNGLTTKSTASVLKNYIRADITDSIGQVGFSVVDDNGVQKLSSSLTSKSISEQTLYNSDPNDPNSDGPLSDDDTFLVYDDSSTLLKKVAFSDIKSANSFDIENFNPLSINDSVTDNDLIVLKDSESTTHKKVTISEFKSGLNIPNDLEYIPVTNAGLITPTVNPGDIYKANKHYHIKDNVSDGSLFTFNLTSFNDISEGDIVKISMSYPDSPNSYYEESHNNRGRFSSLKLNVKVDLGNDLVIYYNGTDFHSPKEFLYDGTRWFASILDKKDFHDNSYYELTGTQAPIEFSNISLWRQKNSVTLGDTGATTTRSVNIPSALEAYENGFINGDKKTFYFTDIALQKLIINSSQNDIWQRSDATNNSNYLEFGFTNQKTIKFSGEGIKKVVITFIEEYNNKYCWLIENYIDEVEDVTLPSALTGSSEDSNKVLKFDSSGTSLIKGTIQSVNISDNAIITSKINENAVTKSKLEKVNPNKVLGYVGTLTNPQNVSEVNVLDNLSDDIPDKHSNLATAEAIKQHISASVGSLSVSSLSGGDLNSYNINDDNLTVQLDLEDTNSIANVSFEASSRTIEEYYMSIKSGFDFYRLAILGNFYNVDNITRKIYLPSAESVRTSYGFGSRITIKVDRGPNFNGSIWVPFGVYPHPDDNKYGNPGAITKENSFPQCTFIGKLSHGAYASYDRLNFYKNTSLSLRASSSLLLTFELTRNSFGNITKVHGNDNWTTTAPGDIIDEVDAYVWQFIGSSR